MNDVIPNLYLIPMLISAILSLKVFKLSWPLAYKIFSILLFTALATDILGTLWDRYLYQFKEWDLFYGNYWILTFSIAPQYLLYMAVYHEVLKSRQQKRIIQVLAIVFTLFVILNFTFGQGLYVINSLSHLFADCIMLILIFFYFEQIRKQKEILILSKQPMVWISAGVFIYHLLNIPVLYCLNFLVDSDRSGVYSFLNFYKAIIFCSYLLFIKALLCPTPQPQK
jgi:hypothetical protein